MCFGGFELTTIGVQILDLSLEQQRDECLGWRTYQLTGLSELRWTVKMFWGGLELRTFGVQSLEITLEPQKHEQWS